MINPKILEEKFGCRLLPHQYGYLKQLYADPYPILNLPRHSDKEGFLALYILSRLFQPFETNRIAVASPTFRDSKLIFRYCIDLLSGETITSSEVCNDLCKLQYGSNTAIFTSLGNGIRLRGHRANIFIANSVDQLDTETLEAIYCGLAAISNNPLDELKARAYGYKSVPDHQIVRVYDV